MIAFKIVRKIGKILRGGAGRKEIALGVLCGVLIGFNPGINMTLAFAILITLLLNANVPFVLLGAALGKVLCLALSPITFHTGYFIIHNMGMENSFTDLVNSPVTALMDLNVYSMVGGLPYALVIGFAVGSALGTVVIKLRKKMLEADQHEIIGKTFGNKFARFLLRLAFGKSKLSLDDEIPRQAPLLRKSGLILVGVVVLISLVLEFFLLDITIKNGLQSGLSKATGAEVNIGNAHLSLMGGKLELEDLQITDPDKPTHNLLQLDALAIDTSIRDLLRRNYVIELMAGDTLKRDVLRDKPGEVYIKPDPEKPEEDALVKKDGTPLEDYLVKARHLRKYCERACEYLDNRKDNIKTTRVEKLKASKEAAVVDARKYGYLKASADLVADRPTWTIRRVELSNVLLGGDYPAQTILASELSSHPEMLGKPTILSMKPADRTQPTVKFVLRFDNPAARHALSANLEGIAMGDTVETSDSFPVDINDGKVDIKADGTFSTAALQIPFTVTVHDLKASVEEGRTVMGMDAETATEVFNSIEQLEIEGVLMGALDSPRVKIDYDKLTANMKEALVDAGKKELSKRANAEMDKAKDEAKAKAGEELDKAMQSEEAEEVKSKATDALKKLF